MKVVLLGEALAVEKLQVVLLEVLGTAEKDLFGLGKALWLGQFRAGEFKRTGEIRNLKEPVFRRLDFRDELGAGRKDRKCLFEKGGQVFLSVVVVDLKFVEGVEIRSTLKQA